MRYPNQIRSIYSVFIKVFIALDLRISGVVLIKEVPLNDPLKKGYS